MIALSAVSKRCDSIRKPNPGRLTKGQRVPRAINGNLVFRIAAGGKEPGGGGKGVTAGSPGRRPEAEKCGMRPEFHVRHPLKLLWTEGVTWKEKKGSHERNSELKINVGARSNT